MIPTSIDGTDITGATIDGTDVTEITVDGDTVFTAGLPESVQYQYVAENFASPWPDETGTSDMNVNGLSASTFSNGEPSVFGDGSSDHGLASGPNNLPENEKFGIAFTVEGTDTTLNSRWWGSFDGDHRLILVQSESPGHPVFYVREPGGILDVEANQDIMDGNPHIVIINKNGNDASDIDFYIDDMTSSVSTTIHSNGAFDHTNYSNGDPFAFYARGFGTGTDKHLSYDAGIFEFRDQVYSQSDRTALKNSRPEV